MHPYLSHRNHLSPSFPYVRGYREPARAAGLLRRWLRAASRQWQRRKMIATLEALDDWTLRDIGIHRGDIPRVVDGFDNRELGMVPFAPISRPVETNVEAFRKAA